MKELDLAQAGDLLLKGAVPVGFVNMDEIGVDPIDILIDSNGIVTKVGTDLPVSSGDRCLDLEGYYISPGWIDLHTHIYEGACDIGINPDLIGPRTGVAMLVDAGSAGDANFRGLRKFIIEQRAYPIKAFLNIGSIGCTAANRVSEIGSFECFDLLRSRKCVEANRDLIKGIKVRASKAVLKGMGNQPVVIAKRLAEEMGLPLMVHIGEPPIYLEELIHGILEAGDVITHIYHGKVGTSLLGNTEKMLGLYQAAVEKGIRLDVGHGSASFSYEAARLAIAEGLKPYTISTDLHSLNYRGPVWSLAAVMSKMLAVGLSIPEVISMVTLHPATILRETGWNVLKVGHKAMLTCFSVKEGLFPFIDSAAASDTAVADPKDQKQFLGHFAFCPHYTIVGSVVYEAQDPYLKYLNKQEGGVRTPERA